MDSKEFARRRRQLMRMMGAGSIAILPAAPVRKRSRDVEYRFRQDSDFYYLTGFAEPEAVAVLVPGRDSGEYLLFCRERDKARELWDGSRAGQHGAVSDYGADDAFPIDDIDGKRIIGAIIGYRPVLSGTRAVPDFHVLVIFAAK